MDYPNSDLDLKSLELQVKDGKYLKYHLAKPKVSRGICFFLHGLGDSSITFSKLISVANSRGYSALYYDLPGFSTNKNYELDSFSENIDILNQLISLHSHSEKTNYFIGHSMGGLIVLLTLVKCDLPVSSFSVLTIEPSITTVDFNFFQSIQEPPLGMGYLGFLERNEAKVEGAVYSKVYFRNLVNSSSSAFREYVVDINERFSSYQNLIFQSAIPFIYTYGINSSGISSREKMKEYENVQVRAFECAGHWVHIDAEQEFCGFFINDFLKS
jgi:pimeloyl-ACP methyl ester carboxylesterase